MRTCLDRRSRGGWFAALAAAATLAVAGPAGAATGPSAAPATRLLTGSVVGLSCGSAATCVGLIRHSSGASYVGKLVNDGASVHLTKVPKSKSLAAISCPSSHGCEAIGTDKSKTIFASVSSAGKLGKPHSAASRSFVSASDIACHANSNHCLAVGSFGADLDLLSLSGSAVEVKRKAIPKGLADGYGVACPTASYCEVVGVLLPNDGKNKGFALAVHNGRPGKLVTVASANNNGLVGLGCDSATTCYTVASNVTGAERLVTLTAGKVTHTVALPTGTNAAAVSCGSRHTCYVVGRYETATAYLGEIIPILAGKLGKPQTSSITSGYQFSSDHGRLVTSGPHGTTRTVISS